MSITGSQSHDHHDCYKHYELKKYKKKFHCVGCQMEGSGERYVCNLCPHELHKECRDPEPEVFDENFGGPVFKFYVKPFTSLDKKKRIEFSKSCDACKKDICGFNYHCDKLDLHPCCVKLEKKQVIDGMKKSDPSSRANQVDNMSITGSQIHEHDCYKHYELKTYEKLFQCVGCLMDGFRERYTCNLCGCELHEECRNPEPKVSDQNFGGSVFKFYDKPFTSLDKKKRIEFSKRCDACGKDICGFNYHCDKLDLHPCCVKLEKKHGTIFDLVTKVSSEYGQCGMKKSDPSSRANQEDSRSITGSQNHDCYKHYKLKKCAKLFECVGCKMNGFGVRYACNLCGHELHQECRCPESEVSHENFVFKLYDKPLTRWDKKKRKEISNYCCDACGMDICGFYYHCEEGKLDLHPCCARLEKKKLIDDTIFDLVTEVSSRCGKCGEKMVSRAKENVLGWSYVSQCRNYHFHVYCLSEMVQEAWMKHGDMALEKMDLSKLVRYNKNKGGGKTFLKTIESFVTILLSVLLGDPTMVIPNVAVQLFSLAFQL